MATDISKETGRQNLKTLISKFAGLRGIDFAWCLAITEMPVVIEQSLFVSLWSTGYNIKFGDDWLACLVNVRA